MQTWVCQMRPSSAKAKGRRLQQAAVADLLAAFPELSRDDVRSCAGGAHGEDVQLSAAARRLIPWSIEAKCVERLNLYAAWEQCVQNAGPHAPVVVSKRNRHEALCTMRWTDALALLVAAAKRAPAAPRRHAPPGTAAYLRALADELEEEGTVEEDDAVGEEDAESVDAAPWP